MRNFNLLLVFILFALANNISAQVTFVVQSLPAYTPAEDSLFMAGSFNGWDPGSPEYVLHKNGEGKWSITLASQQAGTVIKFKFTRGSWATVEKGPSGEEISDRSYTFGGSQLVDVTIHNWADFGGGGNSTAAENVSIISTDFYMPQLNRNRRIWMYFPPGYETSTLSYPVLYMHDGQNLFDVNTAYAGEWEVDETLNKLATQGKQVPLVVGIDNGGSNRIGEYTPWPNSQYGGGDGDKYMQFIVETLKPYIDQHYRTLPDRENTGIMGSSLGGLISHFGSLQYQDVFSKAGLFSPSYWFSDSVWSFTHDAGKQHDLRFYQLCGANESAGMVAAMQRMNDSLVSIGFGQDIIFNKVVPAGQHNEKLWREAFGEAYLWLFDPYANSTFEATKVNTIECYPNPVIDILTFGNAGTAEFDTVQVIDLNGRVLKSFSRLNEQNIDVRDLLPGLYVLKCSKADVIYTGKFIKK